MTGCAEVRDALGPYVLGALDPEEAADVAAHLAGCEPCAAEHRALAGLPGLLANVADPERDAAVPPARLEEAVLDRHALDQARASRPPAPRTRVRRQWRGRRLALGAAAAAALAVGSLGVSGVFRSGTDEALGYEARLAGTAMAPGAAGRAQLVPAAEGTAVRLRVRRLPPGRSYELWCVRNDGRWISAGTFRSGTDGAVDVRLTTAARLGTYRFLRVTPTAASAGSPVLRGVVPS